jgi:hypothetical protein
MTQSTRSESAANIDEQSENRDEEIGNNAVELHGEILGARIGLFNDSSAIAETPIVDVGDNAKKNTSKLTLWSRVTTPERGGT